ncbi:MAG: protein-L-isoaspartate(D-aspartate) O-methyltransferase [Candidatus Omnitrophica bacterium]|nr:protein-L-isoaspartate(D-aspartate) O-methyltransferase [Candidatus Omnitrophota bacterium]
MDLARLRNKMVDEQIAARGITDERLLNALRRVPRHEFVPKEAEDLAYRDCPVPIGEGQTISQPFMVALMTQCLDLNKTKRVLEVGTGSGYQTAILAELCQEVCSIERIGVLAECARQRLVKLKYTNVKIVHGDGSLGGAESPQLFDAAIITAAAPARLDHFFAQLASDGKMVVPIGDRFSQTLKLFTKSRDEGIIEESVCGCTFVPLIGEYGWPHS